MHFKLFMSVITLIYCVQLAKSWHFRGNQRSPVILVPGDGGCQLEAKLDKTNVVHYVCTKKTEDYFNIWLNLELLVPVVIDCWIDNVKLYYDNVTRKTSNAEGVDVRVPGWGDPFTVEYLDPSKVSVGSYFKDIGNMLVSDLGYIRNLSLRGAPYDFRRGPGENEDFFVKLKALVEETYLMNNKAPVTLLAHSMGGPMSLVFLQRQTQKWKDQYVNSMMTLSGAWGGSVKAVKVFAIGDDLGAYLLRGSVLKDEQITSPSLGWLLPSKLFWKDDEVLVITDKMNYTMADLQQFLLDVGVPNGWEFRKDNEQYQNNFSAPGVEVHCLYGTNVDTVEQLYYKPGTSVDGTPKLLPGDGDGTVNLRSLEGCLHWKSQQKQRVYNQGFPKVDHLQILKDPNVLNYLRTVLSVH